LEFSKTPWSSSGPASIPSKNSTKSEGSTRLCHMNNRKKDSRKQWVHLSSTLPTSEDTQGAPQEPACHPGYQHMWVKTTEHKDRKYFWAFLIQNFFQNF
jgi:hypothetical protein